MKLLLLCFVLVFSENLDLQVNRNDLGDVSSVVVNVFLSHDCSKTKLGVDTTCPPFGCCNIQNTNSIKFNSVSGDSLNIDLCTDLKCQTCNNFPSVKCGSCVAPDSVVGIKFDCNEDVFLRNATQRYKSEFADTCSLYEISGDTCGQSDLDCKYTSFAKAAEPGLKDGTCASQGYTVEKSTTSKKYPVVGTITITEYTKPSSLIDGHSADTCSLYEISGDTCGQSDIDCTYAKYAKLAEPNLKDGTCMDQGYTLEISTTTKSYPVVGDITITEYKQL